MTQTTPVRQPTEDPYQAEQLCVVVHVCVGFPGRGNVAPFQRFEAQYIALGDAGKDFVLQASLPFKVTR